jgi:hypothetical protein
VRRRSTNGSSLRWLGGIAPIAFLLSAVLVTAPAGATSLAVTVSPAKVGSAAAPAAQSVTFDLSNIAAGQNGEPTEALVHVTQHLPADFTDELARFATCPASALSSDGSSPPPCPKDSELGTAQLSAYIPSLMSSVTTNQGYIFKSGAGKFRAWVHVNRLESSTGAATSINVSLTLPGTITAGSKTSGPVASWDLSAAVDMGVQARITRFASDWATGEAQARSSKKAKHHKAKRKAPAKAGGHAKHHRRGKRRTKRTSRHDRSRRPRASSAQAKTATSTASVFESTACSGGSWAFSVTATYSNSSSESVESAVDCQTGANTPAPPPSHCLPLALPTCIDPGVPPAE